MVDLNDPIYEFLRNDRVFLMDLYEDRVDPRLPWTLAGSLDRERLAGALRQLADVFASRPDLPIPKDGYVRLDVIADGERRVAEIEHGPAGYRFQVLPGAYEQASRPQEAPAPMVAAADNPAATRRGSHDLTQPTRLERRKLSTATSGRRMR
jgi:hypothetical protein